MPDDDKKAEDKTSEGEKGNGEEKTEGETEGSGKESTAKKEEPTPEVKKLRKENAKKRVENKELRDKLAKVEATKSETEDAKKDTGGKDTSETPDLLTIINKRYIRSELKGAALKAGLKDIDALRMFDTSSLEIDKSGEVVGIDDLIEEMRESKDYLFNQQTKDTSSGKKTPGEAAPSSKNALDMSEDEYAVEAKKLKINTENQY